MKKLFAILPLCAALSSLGQTTSILSGNGPANVAGVEDDGSAGGVIRSKVTRGNLVKMPFLAAKYSSDNVNGGATAVFNAGAGQTNPDGSGSTLFVTVPTGGSIRILQTFYGTVFGARWTRGTADFGIVIDGIAYRVTSTLKEPELASAIAGTAEAENLTVVADDLPDGPHVAEFIFTNATGSQITWNLWGYVVEARAGHGGIPRAAGVVNATTVPSSDTAIVDTTFRSIRKVFYWNTDTVTRTVTIKQNNVTIAVLTLATLTGTTFDLGDFVALQSTASGTGQFSHICDLAGKVNFLPIGGL